MFSSDSLPFRISSKLYCIRFLPSRMSYSRQTGRESAIRVRICFIIFRQFPHTFSTVTSQHLSVMSLAARIRNPICFEKIGTPAKWGLDLMNTSQLKNSPPEPSTVAASILDLPVYTQDNDQQKPRYNLIHDSVFANSNIYRVKRLFSFDYVQRGCKEAVFCQNAWPELSTQAFKDTRWLSLGLVCKWFS